MDDFCWIAYKKVTRDFREFVLTLAIPYDAGLAPQGAAIRSDSVVVLGAEDVNGIPVKYDKFYSMYDWSFIYQIGNPAKSSLDTTKGIFCFASKDDARNFMTR